MQLFNAQRLTIAAMAAVALASGSAVAQEYPARPVRIVAPFAPGATGDLTMRLAAEYLEKQLKQPFVVENRAGAGGLVGANEAKKAPADGYTLLAGIDNFTTFSVFVKDNTFDLQKDFAPISMLARFPLVMLTNTETGGKSVAEFIAAAKANPGKLNFGIIPNTPSHLFAILFMNRTGVQLELVGYQAAVALTQSLVAGQVQATASVYGSFAPHIKAGKVAAVGIAGPTKLKIDPSVPLLAEQKLPIMMTVWYALFAPTGTPQPAIQKLAAASAEWAKQQAVVERLDKLGIEAVGSTPADLAKAVADDTRDRTEAARLGKIQPQ